MSIGQWVFGLTTFRFVRHSYGIGRFWDISLTKLPGCRSSVRNDYHRECADGEIAGVKMRLYTIAALIGCWSIAQVPATIPKRMTNSSLLIEGGDIDFLKAPVSFSENDRSSKELDCASSSGRRKIHGHAKGAPRGQRSHSYHVGSAAGFQTIRLHFGPGQHVESWHVRRRGAFGGRSGSRWGLMSFGDLKP
jgi:hypothetical protein